MDILLDANELRVLGSLLEKQMTTPDYYPMTINSIAAACNQKTNREPVMDLTENEVSRALGSLHDKGLIHTVSGGGSRAAKYGQMIVPKLQLSVPQKAALCVLMLRGPQTIGEIRGRTDRMYNFGGLIEVEQTLDSLMSHPQGSIVVRLEREPGRKEHRFAQILAGMPDETMSEYPASMPGISNANDDRIAKLEEQVQHLRSEIEKLHNMFSEFKRQFE